MSGFEYNGFIHRDLEPQVRYDAEQVQLLKQADVTINENLQTINTEISSKLTKPTNPSAESAVTMLADGTVGTKLLSEIGGGGKLYLHTIRLTSSEFMADLIFQTTNDKSTNLQGSELDKYFASSNICAFDGASGNGVVNVYGTITSNICHISGVITSSGSSDYQVFTNKTYNFDAISDTITEL